MKKSFEKSAEPSAEIASADEMVVADGVVAETGIAGASATAASGGALPPDELASPTDDTEVSAEAVSGGDETEARPSPVLKPETIIASYVPPPSVMKKLVRRSVGLTGEETVSMPAPVYNKLLETALAAVFDDDAYLKRFPDIKAAIDAGKLQSALQHFLVFGYGEGRPPRQYDVDEAWYLSTYRDVAKAVGAGQVGNATQHFEAFGFAEGRAPNRNYEKTVAEWRRLEPRPGK